MFLSKCYSWFLACLDLIVGHNFFPDPSEMIDNWRLIEGFVAEEGKTILPHLAKTRPNLVENHMALLLSSFINAGIFEVSETVKHL